MKGMITSEFKTVLAAGYTEGRLESGKKYLGVYNCMGKVSLLKLSRECKEVTKLFYIFFRFYVSLALIR